jgi:hypothetical protein
MKNLIIENKDKLIKNSKLTESEFYLFLIQ